MYDGTAIFMPQVGGMCPWGRWVCLPLCLPVWQPTSPLDLCGGCWERVGTSSNRGRSVLCSGPGLQPQMPSCAHPPSSCFFSAACRSWVQEGEPSVPPERQMRFAFYRFPCPGSAAAGCPSPGRDIASDERRVRRHPQSFLPVGSVVSCLPHVWATKADPLRCPQSSSCASSWGPRRSSTRVPTQLAPGPLVVLNGCSSVHWPLRIRGSYGWFFSYSLLWSHCFLPFPPLSLHRGAFLLFRIPLTALQPDNSMLSPSRENLLVPLKSISKGKGTQGCGPQGGSCWCAG